jgi:hypothetical protein
MEKKCPKRKILHILLIQLEGTMHVISVSLVIYILCSRWNNACARSLKLKWVFAHINLAILLKFRVTVGALLYSNYWVKLFRDILQGCFQLSRLSLRDDIINVTSERSEGGTIIIYVLIGCHKRGEVISVLSLEGRFMISCWKR